MKRQPTAGHRSKQATVVALVSGGALAYSLALMAPASADTYSAPFHVVEVGTDGSDAGGYYPIPLTVASAPAPLLAVSHGGCAQAAVSVAIGESNRTCGWNNNEAQGWVLGVSLLGADGGVSVGGDGWLAVGGGNAEGVVAVSDTGNAHAWCIFPIPWGDWCAEPGIAISGTGAATGDGHTVSGAGPAYSDWGGTDNNLWPILAVSGLGNAGGGHVVVSGAGDADAHSTTATFIPVTYHGVAVAGRDAHAHGGALAVGGGSAYWGDVAIAGQGSAIANYVGVSAVGGTGAGVIGISGLGNAYGGKVAIAGGHANAFGGLVAVSLTGNATGGSVANIAPLGTAG